MDCSSFNLTQILNILIGHTYIFVKQQMQRSTHKISWADSAFDPALTLDYALFKIRPKPNMMHNKRIQHPTERKRLSRKRRIVKAEMKIQLQLLGIQTAQDPLQFL